MQCPSCKSKWNLDPSVSQQKINKCPFCGASLKTKKKPDTSTIEGVLRSIVLEYGEKIYENSNAQRFKALLYDLAVRFPKERKGLNIAIDNQIPARLLKKNGSNNDEKTHEVTESTYILVDTIGFQPEIAQGIVNILAAGLGWKIKTRSSSAGKSIQKKQSTQTGKGVRKQQSSQTGKSVRKRQSASNSSGKNHKAISSSSSATSPVSSKKQSSPSPSSKKSSQRNKKQQSSKRIRGQYAIICFLLLFSIGVYFIGKKKNVSESDQKTTFSIDSVENSTMIFVEGGTFQMGSTSGDSDEKPVHSVTVLSFYMCDHEVTQKEYCDVMGTNPSYYSGDNRPVENMSWYNAIEYCNRRSMKEGLTPCYTIDKSNMDSNNTNSSDDLKWTVKCNFSANGYRLPTEAEWEYAAKGGKKSEGYTYSGSNSIGNVAWYDGNISGNRTHDVKTKPPNELELYDMSGNVYEWCWDWMGAYSSSSQTNPTGASSGSLRVLRGGCCSDYASFCRVANRFHYTPSGSYYNLGFRVVRSSSK